ncbi:Uncharacterised protein [Mycobacteroides abscessus]|nr:Uncharacterised protein [Mycobacteroides abscessus]
MLALGRVEEEGPRDGLEHGVGHAPQVPPLEPRVVVDAHPGEAGDLVAAQPVDAPTAAVRLDARLLGRHPGAAAHDELAHLGTVVHGLHVLHGSAGRRRDARAVHPSTRRGSGPSVPPVRT